MTDQEFEARVHQAALAHPQTMFAYKDEYRFADQYGALYRAVWTHRPDQSPLTITVLSHEPSASIA